MADRTNDIEIDTDMILTRDQARTILDKVLSYAKSDEAEASLSGGVSGNLRFARNSPTTSGATSTLSLSVTCVFGKRVGSHSTTQTDDDSLREAVRRAEELAHLSPESPEYMPRLGPQTYIETPQWDESTVRMTPDDRARIAGLAIEEARKKDLVSAGYFENGESFSALANSRGLFGYHLSTGANYTLTVRTADGTGSGWAAAESHRALSIDANSITARAIEKALRSKNPAPIEPGAYRVVLEPSAAGDMVKLFRWSLDRRGADEGRSYFSDAGHGTKIDQKLFGDNITIYSDPASRLVPSEPWGGDGMPLGRTVWVEHGVLKTLAVDRFWAKEKNLTPIPWGSNTVMEGGEHSLDDLVAATDHGLLVTSFWYIRGVDPRSILYTGLTRDGVFLIENGKIVRPVINLRWNESPAAIFKGVEMMSRPERIVTREGNQPMLVPAMKVKEFHFTSVSTST
ncbi:MAG: peptidase [Chlorobi bacterium]|nr:peptidase [Chlorobiota bacterium]